MSTALSTVQLTRNALTLREVDKNDLAAFISFYTDGRPDKIFVSVASFLEWKGMHVRSKQYPHAAQSRDWTFAYRSLALKHYPEESEMVFKKDASGFLLFDVEFLLLCYDDAFDVVSRRLFGME